MCARNLEGSKVGVAVVGDRENRKKGDWRASREGWSGGGKVRRCLVGGEKRDRRRSAGLGRMAVDEEVVERVGVREAGGGKGGGRVEVKERREVRVNQELRQREGK